MQTTLLTDREKLYLFLFLQFSNFEIEDIGFSPSQTVVANCVIISEWWVAVIKVVQRINKLIKIMN